MLNLDQLKIALSDRYAIERELGAGGTATVYLARDLKHNRNVAIKVLRPELAALIGTERFLSEIQLTAKLQHPHMLPLFDSGEASGLLYYVMPYVEGESLRAKLEREMQLPISEAVRIAMGVASALDYAHRHGIVHRDIKPENILLHDGAPLVADFGIALAISRSAGTRLTETGISMGTPQYMSPEQAAGDRPLDARSDIYSLGVVLFEMLTGEPPHTGNSVQAVIAKVLANPAPSARLQRAAVPAALDAALNTALSKVPADRFAAAAEFAAALDRSLSLDARTRFPSFATPLGNLLTRRPAVAGLSAGMIALLAYVGFNDFDAARAAPMQWSVALPDSAPLAFIGQASLGVGQRALAVSPDGRALVYVGQRAGGTALYRHTIGTFEITLIPGTEGAFHPFFSPDGTWVGFFANSKLKKVRYAGGAPVSLADVTEPMGASWSAEGVIAVANDEGGEILLFSESGGRAIKRLSLPTGPARSIQLLPGGRSVLIRTGIHGGLAVVTVESGAVQYIDAGGAEPTEVPPINRITGYAEYREPGWLLNINPVDNILLARRFDVRSLRVRGAPVPVLFDLRSETVGAQFSISESGLLVFVAGRNAVTAKLVWASRNGRVDTLPLPEAAYGQPDISPNGAQLAVAVLTPDGSNELRLYDLRDLGKGVQQSWRREGVGLLPRFSADGTSIVTPGLPALRIALPLGTKVDTLGPGSMSLEPSPDGRYVIISNGGPHHDIEVVDAHDNARRSVIRREGRQLFARLSPNGNWLAYTSSETGRWEIWLEPFPPNGQRQKVSQAGGEESTWSPAGDRLYYRYSDTWYEVDIDAKTGRAGSPRVFISGPFLNVPGYSYDVDATGQKLLLIAGPSQHTGRELRFIRDFDRLIENALKAR